MVSRKKRLRSQGAGPFSSDRPVLIDTNIWIAYESRRDAAVRVMIDRLAERELALFVPPVRFEFARGLSGPDAALDHTLSRYDARFPTLPLEDTDWNGALRLVRRVAGDAERHAVQLTDALLAAASVRTGAFVWSRDPDLARLHAADARVRPLPA